MVVRSPIKCGFSSCPIVPFAFLHPSPNPRHSETQRRPRVLLTSIELPVFKTMLGNSNYLTSFVWWWFLANTNTNVTLTITLKLFNVSCLFKHVIKTRLNLLKFFSTEIRLNSFEKLENSFKMTTQAHGQILIQYFEHAF